MSGLQPTSSFPFNYPTPYSPGQMAFNNNAELSQLITMFAGPLLGQMAGPGNFMPHMMPGQALTDQFAMRNYQQQTRQSAFNVANYQNDDVANRLLGIRSAFTGQKATDMNKEQAAQMAGVLNNPVMKTVMGMAMGPENVEAMLHGSRGDVQSLNSTINRIGYFRRDPSGGSRMDAESLEDLTTGVFSHLYEPQGDVNKLATRARAGGGSGDAAIMQLQEAADMKDKKVISDNELSSRLLKDTGADKVGQLYNKYVQGGTATSAAEQAKELTRFDRAIKDADILKEDEASIGQLQTRAKRRPTDEMHGFMAGQVSQMTENLFQRGMLPSSIGALDAKGRAAAISEVKLDDATVERLARKEAERDILGRKDDRAAAFSHMTDSQKKEEIDKVVGSYETKIRATKKAADDVTAGRGSASAEEVMQMTGGAALAGNVDASRTSSRIKQYTESVKAVRDIFGDNGNPNAPMPALMAVLDQLTQGSMGSMNPASTASTLRQMQTLARETGTGMQQIGAISAHAGNLGQQLGIAPSITMQNVANTLGLTKSAMDRGAFGNNVFGTRGKEEFQQHATQMLQSGDASGNAKAMAALNRIYAMDKGKYDKGGAGGGPTELAAAMAAYNDPNSDGSYTFTDASGRKVTKNLFQEIGRSGAFGAAGMLERSGGNRGEMAAVIHDSRTGEFQQAGKGFLTQKHARLNRMSQMTTVGVLANSLKDKKSRQYTGALENMDANQERKLSGKITEMVFDSSNMNLEDQMDYLQKHMKPELVAHFKNVGHPDPEAAAQQVYEKVGKDRGRLNTLIGNLGMQHQRLYGGENMAAASQMYGQGRDTAGMLEAGKAMSRTESAKRLVGYESTMGQRVSDYLLDIGERGEKFNVDALAESVFRTVGDRTIAKAYAGEMGTGMDVLSKEKSKVSLTAEDIKAVGEKAKSDPAAAKKLREMAGISDDTLVVAQKEVDDARDSKLAGMGVGALREEYGKHFKDNAGKALSGLHLTEDQLRAELKDNSQFNAAQSAEVRTQKQKETGKTKIMTEDEVTAVAINRSLGKAREGASNQAAYEDISTIQRAFDKGDDTAALKAGVSAADRHFKKTLQEHGVKEGELKELVTQKGDAAQGEILKKFGLTKEQFDAALKQDDPSKTKEGRAAQAAAAYVGMQASKKYGADALGQAQQAANEKQKVDKANIDAGTVVINADKIEGKDGATKPSDKPAAAAATAPGAPASAAAAAAAASGEAAKQAPATAPGAPASAAAAAAAASGEAAKQAPASLGEINKEMSAISGRMKKTGGFFGFGAKETFASAEDEKRYRELSAAKQQALIEHQKQKTTPADTAEKKEDKPLPPAAEKAAEDVKEAKVEQKAQEAAAPAATPEAATIAAEEVKQKADAQVDAVAATDKPLDPVATTENKAVADELQKKTAAAAVASAVGPAAAEQIVKDKPADEAAFKKATEAALGYAQEPAKQNRIDPVTGMLTAGAEQRAGADALLSPDGGQDIAAQMLGGATLGDIEKNLAATGELKTTKPVEPQKDIVGAAISEVTGAFQPDRNAVLSEGKAARDAARKEILEKPEAAAIPAEKTGAAVSGRAAATYGSANISPANVAASISPQQQQAAAGIAGAQASSSANTMTINGRLSLDGLQEAILDATGQKAVSTPGNGVPVVGDPAPNRVSGGAGSGAKR
jgi:hypothetical protein